MHRAINIGQGDEPITNEQAPSREEVMKMSGLCRSRLRTPVVPYNTSQYRSVIAPPTAPILVKLPKRLRFIYFWARTRMVQRGLMVCLVVWIFLVLYKLGIVDHLTSNTTSLTPVITEQVVRPILLTLGMVNQTVLPVENKQLDSSEHLITNGIQGSGADFKLYHQNPELWRSLPPQHWSTLFGYYNISLSGR
ncbi:sterol regulatory element-binding protein cleavage-activating protein-like [Limulus polyphemus]|uniref:Sterol regulatory element-binding protein cleavage-activating protein-like n=1 Tax=Limulus polyphemus TaxID=6850 RepID=A0ABM1RZC8_LIMPO|nr:sterol regulatory element-binding protein cleavage-activating protein-like [Limulus polyphemus]